MGIYCSLAFGLVNTFTLACAIAIILISAMFGDRFTWMALIASLVLHLGLGGSRSGNPPARMVETALPLTALFTGLTCCSVTPRGYCGRR